MRRFLVSIPLALATAAAVAPRSAHAQPRFTVDDALDLVTYRVADLSTDGQWLAALSSTRRDGLTVNYHRDGDPTYLRPQPARVWVIDTRSGARRAVFADTRDVGGAAWSPDAARLALLVRQGESWQPVLWERAGGRLTPVAVPNGKYVAENSDLRWTDDGRSLVFSLHTTAWRDSARAHFARQTSGPIFVQSSKDPFLAWDAIRRRANVRSVVAVDVVTKRARELIPETMVGSYTLARDGGVTWTEDITKKTDYDVIFGSEHRLVTRGLADSSARTLFPSTKGTTVVWAEDGTRYAFARDGRIRVASTRDTATRLLAGPAPSDTGRLPTDSVAADSVRARRERARFTPIRFSPSGDALLASNKDGLWVVDVASGERTMFSATPDSTSRAPTRAVVAWSADGRWLYLSHASREKWERGLVRYDRTTRALDTLVMDARGYSSLRLSKDGSTAVLSIADVARPGDLYVADADLKNVRRLVRANPQLDGKALGSARLIDYLDADGHRKYGVAYLPPGFREGTRYPTVFNIYEEFFNDGFDPVINVLTAHDYVVVQPSVDFDVGYPGEAWVKGVTSAANKLIEMGVADSAKLGVHGTSYGGYAANLLIAQTNRFKAAINISGKVDMISFYTDSPRLGVRNIHAAEKSQDRIGATLWQQPQKYVQHSAIMFADRITTPLLLLTGQQDQNVPADNTREMYYALRRLGRDVTWVNYMNGGHGAGNASEGDYRDYVGRILGWYDTYLKKDAAKKTAAVGAQ